VAHSESLSEPLTATIRETIAKPVPTALQKSARLMLGAIGRLIIMALAAVIAVTAGFLSSRYMIERGSMLTTDTYGPWVSWREAGRPDADPYTRAHFAKSGALVISADSAGTFEARTDTQGARLHSSCDYVFEGPSSGGLWWSLAVFDDAGDVIPNDAGRYVFTSDTIASNPDGSYIVTLGRDARPGNWLPTGGAGRIVLVFTILDPATGLSNQARSDRHKNLPLIRREGCS
jgi:hypothetical protein